MTTKDKKKCSKNKFKPNNVRKEVMLWQAQ
ncbi:hypothetical protein M2140_000055 [Clostridiales Family XIII bacterium PM5-7]